MFEEFTSVSYYLSRVLSNMSFDSTATSGLFKPLQSSKKPFGETQSTKKHCPTLQNTQSTEEWHKQFNG